MDGFSLAQHARGIPQFMSRANYYTKPLMFEGFLNRTAGLSSGLSLTSILMEGAFRDCGGVPYLN